MNKEEEIKEMFKMSPGAILENYKFIQKELEYQKEMEEEYNKKHTKLMKKYSKQKN